MGVEGSVTVVSDLNSAWPLGTDLQDDGDNHLRNIKVALKSLLTSGPAQIGALAVANDLSDLNDAAIARTNLGLGEAAEADFGTSAGDAAEGDHTHNTPTMQVFTSSGTWTRPSGCLKVKVTVQGGGGGGADGDAVNCGAGGGGGGCAIEYIDVSAIASVPVTVGAGGAKETVGGNSSFGAHCQGNGGAGATSYYGFAGGSASGGDINLTGGMSDAGGPYKGGQGGDSHMGQGGGAEESDNGSAGVLYGGGGAGGFKNYDGGAGADGIVIVEEYY